MLAVAAGIVVAVATWRSTVLPGAAVLVVTPAVLHGAHGNKWQAGLSPVLRVGLPLLLGYFAYESNGGSMAHGGRIDTFVLAGAGLLLAMVVDWSIAKELVAAEQAPPAKSVTKRSLVSVASAGVAPNPQGGLSLVLGGRF
jgi:hypothetical protein